MRDASSLMSQRQRRISTDARRLAAVLAKLKVVGPGRSIQQHARESLYKV